MTTRQLRRNDPCPCGSGRKHKHCCMRRDREHPESKLYSSAAHRGQGNLDLGRRLPAQGRSLGQAAMRQVSPGQAQEIQQLLDQTETVTAYGEIQEDIEAAGEVLEVYRPEFEALVRE